MSEPPKIWAIFSKGCDTPTNGTNSDYEGGAWELFFKSKPVISWKDRYHWQNFEAREIEITEVEQ